MNVLKVLTGNEHGGAAEASRLIIDGLMSDKNRLNYVVVFLCKGNFAREIHNKYENNVNILNNSIPPIIGQGLYINKLFNSLLLMVWILKSFIQLWKFIQKNIEIIHTTNNYALLVCCLYKLINKNIKLYSHWRCIGLTSTKKYKFLLPLVDKFICISNAVKESLPINLREKAIVIYDGVDINKIKKLGQINKGKLRKYLDISTETILFGTIGTFSNVKCHDLLIEACKELNEKKRIDFKCVLIGSCPNNYCVNYKKYLQNKVKKYNLSNKVVFLNDDSLDIKPNIMIVDFDFFVGCTWLNGLGEGFGLIYVEAMAHSLSNIAISVGAAKELIQHNKTGYLIPENNYIQLYNAINNHILNRESAKELGQNGYNIAIQNYNVEKCINNIVSLYEADK